MKDINHIFSEIELERKTQNAKWGIQNHAPSKWLDILGEEYGEACKAILEKKSAEYRAELIQMIAVGVAMVECFDRFDRKGVYLAGPIKGCDQNEIHLWRDLAINRLKCKVINPAVRDFSCTDPDSCLNDIVDPDKREIDNCSILLANCWQVSVGTSMEILYARERDKLIVTVVPEGEFISAWIIAHSHKMFYSVVKAVDYINGILKGE